MKTTRARRWWFCVSRTFPALIVLCWWGQGTSAMGKTNSWIKGTSGYWEEPYWSLGLPGTNQAVLFTNGWQALAIGPSTVQNHPESLTVDSLTIAAPSNSFNELLLNYAGLQTPLVIGAPTWNNGSSRRLMVGSNSALVMISSALQVNNN